jgi:hypothetical protein
VSPDFERALGALKSDVALFSVCAVLVGVAVALAVDRADLMEHPTFGRFFSQGFIRAQFGVIAAGLAYVALLAGFAARRLGRLEAGIRGTDASERRKAALLAVAEIDNQALPLNFVSWLLPVSGFVGTVVGVTQAIVPLGSMITGVTSQGADPSAIGDVLGSLNLAFDTTLVGLLGVIPIMGLLMALDVRANRRVAGIWTLLD